MSTPGNAGDRPAVVLRADDKREPARKKRRALPFPLEQETTFTNDVSRFIHVAYKSVIKSRRRIQPEPPRERRAISCVGA